VHTNSCRPGYESRQKPSRGTVHSGSASPPPMLSPSWCQPAGFATRKRRCVVWDSIRCIHWIPHSANLSKVVRKMQIFGAVRHSGILGHSQRASGATASISSSPFDITPADAEETIADLASASPAFSFVPPVPPAVGSKDTIPSQPIVPTAGSRRTFDFADLSHPLPVISGTAVVDGPTRSTMAVSAAAAFAVGVVAMASVVQFHDPGTPRTRSCHTAIQLALPATMLVLLLTACAVACFDRLTSTRARPQAEQRRSRATRFSRGDTQPIHRNTNSDFSMFFNGAAYPRDGPEHLDQEGVLPLFLFRQRINH
jgi:hypothetical protein